MRVTVIGIARVAYAKGLQDDRDPRRLNTASLSSWVKTMVGETTRIPHSGEQSLSVRHFSQKTGGSVEYSSRFLLEEQSLSDIQGELVVVTSKLTSAAYFQKVRKTLLSNIHAAQIHFPPLPRPLV